MLASSGLQRLKERAARESPRRKHRKNRTTRLIMVAILSYVIFIFGSQEFKLYQIRQEKARIEEQIRVYSAKNDLLREQIKYLSSTEYIERAAREQLGLIKEGEVPYIAKPRSAEPSAPDTAQKEKARTPASQTNQGGTTKNTR